MTYTIEARAKDIDSRDCTVNNSRVSCGSIVASSKGSTTFVTVIPGLIGHRHTFRIRAALDDRRDASGSAEIRGINNAPTTRADVYSTSEDTPATIQAPGVLANDTDADGDALSAVLVSGPAHGSLTVRVDGSFDYTPTTNYSGTDAFTYRASDGTTTSAITTVGLTVVGGNDAPVASADSYTTDEDTPVTIPAPGVLANDSDADGDALNAVVVTGPVHGVVTLFANGRLAYVPNADYAGSDSISYRATDGVLTSDVVAVSLTVLPINDAPIAETDTFTTGRDVPIVIPVADVLANDTDQDGDVLQLLDVTANSTGVPALAGTEITFTPSSGFTGAAGFSYGVSDGQGGTASAYVTVNVTAPATAEDVCVAAGGTFTGDPGAEWGCSRFADALETNNLAADLAQLCTAPAAVRTTLKGDVTPAMVWCDTVPVAVADAYEATVGTTLVVTAPGLLTNDTDAGGDPLQASIVDLPAKGTVTGMSSDGSFSYTPDPGAAGTDSFTYLVGDGSALSAPAMVMITLTAAPPPPVNAAPIARNDVVVVNLATQPPGPILISVLDNDTDPDADPLTAVVETPLDIAFGQANLFSNGILSVQLDPAFFGRATVTYRAQDAALQSFPATVYILVNRLSSNVPPTARDDSYSTLENVPRVVAPQSGLLSNDSDPTNEALTATVITLPEHGSLVPAVNGGFTFFPDANYVGPDSFTYVARDFSGNWSQVATVSLDIVGIP